MRKGFLIMLAVVLVAALAAPAVAGTDINGFYRTKAYMSNFKTGATSVTLAKDAPTAAYVEQRLRLKFSSGEENVKAVAFFEIDFGAWGDTAGSSPTPTAGATTAGGIGTGNNTLGVGRNGGGALGGDRINLETKNVYVWFKLPNTTLDFTVGLQNQSDAYAGLIFGGADMAGIFSTGKFGPVATTFGWAKLYENNVNKTDDMTLYVASAKFSPVKELKIGANFYFLQDDTGKVSATTELPGDPATAFTGTNLFNVGGLNKKRVYTPGVDFAFNAGPATLSGFALYQFGKIDFLAPGSTDLNLRAFAADIRADLNAGPGKLFFEGLYVSGGSLDNNSNKYQSIVTLSDLNASPGGNSFFARTDMSILLVNGDDINTSQALVGAAASPGADATSPGNGGRGIWHIAAGFTMKMGDKLTGKVGAGYLAATKLLQSDQGGASAATTRKGKSMGTEVNANVNYNIMKGLDFGLYGAYAWLGDFYKSNLAGAVDPDNVFDLHARLNYAF